jgi:hypothetical protein
VEQDPCSAKLEVELAQLTLKRRIFRQAPHQSTERLLGSPDFDEVIDRALGGTNGYRRKFQTKPAEWANCVEWMPHDRR